MTKPHDPTFEYVLKLYGIDSHNIPEDAELAIRVGEAEIEQYVRDGHGNTIVNHAGNDLIREYAIYPAPARIRSVA